MNTSPKDETKLNARPGIDCHHAPGEQNQVIDANGFAHCTLCEPAPTPCESCGIRHRVGRDNTLCDATLAAPAPLTDAEVARWRADQYAVAQPSLGYLRLLATIDALKSEIATLTEQLSESEERASLVDAALAAIRDIDAHATPVGLADENDPEGNPHHYLVTVGSLHRALGKSGTGACEHAIANKRLSEALEKYGRHSMQCCLVHPCFLDPPLHGLQHSKDCTCGLTAALSEVTR